MEDWVNYQNGNYQVFMNLKNGTKIRKNDLDFFEPSTVESMDIKITNRCNMGCNMCHEGSTIDGKHADLMSPSFLDNLHPYTELALGGGNVLSHPDLIPFLHKCKERRHICNITLNQTHFEQNKSLVMDLIDKGLIYGLGVSLNDVRTIGDLVKDVPNAVVHVIAGMLKMWEFEELGCHHNLKLLILGYKKFRRGEALYNTWVGNQIDKDIKALQEYLPIAMKNNWFKVISFDNLAIKQLNMKSIVDEETWNKYYMGEDGIDGYGSSASMYVDLVERVFAKNSCAPLDKRYPLKDNVEDMFNFLRNQ